MPTLRRFHLYLGCASAPLIVAFCLTGFLQRLVNAGWIPSTVSPALRQTLHTGKALKLGPTLSSSTVTALVLAMSLALIATTLLGVVMAFRFGHRRVATACLLAGVVVPGLFALLAYAQSGVTGP